MLNSNHIVEKKRGEGTRDKITERRFPELDSIQPLFPINNNKCIDYFLNLFYKLRVTNHKK